MFTWQKARCFVFSTCILVPAVTLSGCSNSVRGLMAGEKTDASQIPIESKAWKTECRDYGSTSAKTYWHIKEDGTLTRIWLDWTSNSTCTGVYDYAGFEDNYFVKGDVIAQSPWIQKVNMSNCGIPSDPADTSWDYTTFKIDGQNLYFADGNGANNGTDESTRSFEFNEDSRHFVAVDLSEVPVPADPVRTPRFCLSK